MLPRIVALFILLFTLSGCSEPPYTNINNVKLKALIAEGVPLYDIRRPEEWQQTGIVKGSRLLTFIDKKGRPNSNFLPIFQSEIKKEMPVIIICRSGNRSAVLSSHLMEKMGYTTVYNLESGINRWIKDKNPVQRHKI
ncbi:MAG: rhodanese-like domain-containing protein [Magnetococcales bacterium]|nr:rhodanese-like domain-containing protein [Magnetococcales bacterium]